MMEQIKKHAPLLNAASVFCALAFLAFAAALLAFPVEIKDNVLYSTLYCLTVLVPSLFPFMALTSYAINSGAGEAVGMVLGFLAKYIFRLPKVCTVPILMSFLGGYPAGARGVSLLLRDGRITEEQAGRMMLFCVNPGIAFVVTFLGGSVLGSTRAGWLLFFSVTLAGLLLGFVSGLFAKFPEEATRRTVSGSIESAGSGPRTGDALMRSAGDACSSILKMCACIVLFSGFTAILHGSGIYQVLTGALAAPGWIGRAEASALLSFLIEVTGGVGDAARFAVGPVFYAFGLAFGGLCVHLQVFSFFGAFPAKKWKFFLFRFLHGFLSVGIFLLLLRLFPGDPMETMAFAGGVAYTVGGFSGTVAGGLSLLLMCIAFLLITSKGKEKDDCEPGKKVI